VNLLELRTELATLLDTALGTYTLPNGDTTPAISVRSSGEALPATTTVEGLEVVIIRDPDLTPIPQYSDANAVRTWTVFLVDWSDAVNLEPVGAYLIEVYGGSNVTTLSVPKGSGPQNQMRVTIPTTSAPGTGFPPYDSTVFPTVDAITFTLDSNIDVAKGQLAWSDDIDSLVLGKNGGVVLEVGQQHITLCRNSTGSTIPKGKAVMFAGTIGASGRIRVAPMVADGSMPGYVFFGVTAQAIPNNEDGFVTNFGRIRGINTTAFDEADILWCDPAVPGGFTATEPAAPNLKLPVAAVISSHTNGTLLVRWDTGRRLADLHDVEANGTKDNGDVLAWVAANNRWEPVAQLRLPRSITIADPQTNDSFTILRTTASTTFSSVIATTSSGSVTYEVRYDADRTALGTLMASGTVTNTTTGDSAAITNQPIPIDNYVWLEITSSSGGIAEFNLTMGF